MKRPIVHPSVEAVIAIHQEVLRAHGGSEGVRDRALLESAVAAPQATMMGMPVLTDAIEMAAAYLFYISQNHPFIDANKRTALATCLVFLSENDLLENERLRIDAWEDLTLEVSSGAIDRVEATTRIRKLIK